MIPLGGFGVFLGGFNVGIVSYQTGWFWCKLEKLGSRR
jgi:hypothetical protein